VCLVSGGLQCLANLERTPRLQHSMPPRASGRHHILASSPRAFSRPVNTSDTFTREVQDIGKLSCEE